MKKISFLLLTSLALFANEAIDDKYRGYSYVSVGIENITYQEDIVLGDGSVIHSNASTTSPVYISGSLVKINNRYDFSIDISSTLLPSQSEEEWYVNGDLAQKNQFDALISNMQFLIHYKYTNNHRLLAGLMYKLNTFKRYQFVDEEGNPIVDQATGAKIGLIEERVATLYAALGYGYESTYFANKEHIRYKCSALIGQAIWSQATSTGFEEVTFDSLSSYKAELSGYVGYPIYEGLEIGVFANYIYEKKNGVDVADDGHTKWPENDLELWQTGLSVVWNFSK